MDKMAEAPKKIWQEQVYDLLKAANIKFFTYVPDGGHKHLIVRCNEDPDVTAVPLTIETEGVAFAAGAHLGGKRAVLLMQGSGVGNCINMLSLIENGRFPFLALVTMRGDFGEGNPWQMAMGRAVQPTLEAMNVRCLRAETEADVVPVVEAALKMAFGAEIPVAVLLSQRLLGAKAF
jgi:sulfopyruvate decarboxylase alpha subunit